MKLIVYKSGHSWWWFCPQHRAGNRWKSHEAALHWALRHLEYFHG